jgi:hypothetical protein
MATPEDAGGGPWLVLVYKLPAKRPWKRRAIATDSAS